MSWVFFHEVAPEDWIAPETAGSEARDVINVIAPCGLTDAVQKRLAIARVTEALRAIEGPDVAFASYGPWVQIREVPDGDWGQDGTAVAYATMRAFLTAATSSVAAEAVRQMRE